MTTAEEILEHHGIKGMKWGVRREDGGSSGGVGSSGGKGNLKDLTKAEIKVRTGTEVVARTKNGAGVQTYGGNNRKAHADAVAVRTSEQVAKKSTIDALSTPELQAMVTRMNLEQQYRNLAVNEYRSSAGEKYANKLINEQGDALASKLGPIGPVVKFGIEQAATKAQQNKALEGGYAKRSGGNN